MRSKEDLLLDKGVASFNGGRAEAAILDFTAAIKVNPRRADAFFFRAVARKTAGSLDEARTDIRRALSLDPRFEAAKNFLRELRGKPKEEVKNSIDLDAARRLRDRDDLRGALKAVREVIRLAPQALEAHHLKLMIELDLGLRTDAIKSALEATRLSPRSAPARLLAARFCKDIGEFGLAFGYLRAALRLDPKSLDALLELAQLSLWHGECAEARRRARQAPKSWLALRVLGAAAVLERRYRPALKDLDAALALCPEDRETLVWKAEALRHLKRYEEAQAELDKALTGVPAHEQNLGAHINRLLIKLALKETVTKEDYRPVLNGVSWRYIGVQPPLYSIPPRMIELALARMLGNRGSPPTMTWTAKENARSGQRLHYSPRVATMGIQAAARFGDIAAVLKEFDRQSAVAPHEPYAPASRGEVCLWFGRYAEAAKDIQKSLDLNPRQPWPNIGLAGVNVMLGRYDKAWEHLKRAAKDGSAIDKILMIWRGEIYRRIGQPRKALKEYRKAWDVFPFRPSLWIGVALAQGALGQRAAQEALFKRLKKHYPEFLADAAREARSASIPRVLEKAMELMKGNRSSWLYTYVLSTGEVKHIKLAAVPPNKIPPAFVCNRWMFTRPSD